MTQLDATAPCEIFSSLPGARVHLISRDRTPVTLDFGLAFQPSATYDDSPALDVVFVPGGSGVNQLMEDEACLEFLGRTSESARGVGVRMFRRPCGGAAVVSGHTWRVHPGAADRAMLRRTCS